MKKIVIFIVLFLAFISPADAKRKHPEKWYQDKYCCGIKEYRLSDGTRVDCLTDKYAIEFDFGKHNVCINIAKDCFNNTY